jgi:hypothetical protein
MARCFRRDRTTEPLEDAHEEASHQLRRPGGDPGRRYAGRARSLPPRRHAATREPGGAGACAGGVLVVRQQLARCFHRGVADHNIKELCRIYVSRSVLCEFCGNQRSMKAAKAGIVEDDYRDLINFETSTRYDDKQKAALAYAEAITWDLPTDDKFWARLHKHFSEPELVEIGYFVALTMGQQRWLRTLDIEHHQVLAGTDASMAPGFETEDALARSKQDPGYWARRKATPSQAAE